jgi:hypothetical protein
VHFQVNDIKQTVGAHTKYLIALTALAILCVASEAIGTAHSVPLLAGRFIACLSLLIICFAAIERFIDSRPTHENVHLQTGSLKHIVLYASIILLCWLPILVCLYPGITFSDTSGQLCQYFGNPPEYGAYCIKPGSAFSDHHPIIDTFIMGMLVQVGMSLGSANLGFMFLVMVQSTLLALTVSRMVCFITVRFRWSTKAVFVTIAFFALLPMFPYMAASPVKDTIFIIVFINFIIEFAVVMTSAKLRPLQILILVILTFFMILTKRTGLYVSALCLLGILLLNRHAWKTALISLLPAIIAAGVIFPTVAFPLLNVSPGSKNEMLGFFYQQTARFVRDYPDEVTPKERKAIDAILNYDTLAKRYNPAIVDPVNHGKGVDVDPSKEKIADYAKVFIDQLIRHPDNNLKAVLAQESGWFDLSQRYQTAINFDMAIQPSNGTPNITRPSWIRELAGRTVKTLNSAMTSPIIGLLCAPPVYTTLIPLFGIMLGIRTKRLTRERLLCLLPIFTSLPLLWISPVSDVFVNLEAFRYTLPFLYTAPFTIAFTLSQKTVNTTAAGGQSCKKRLVQTVNPAHQRNSSSPH